MLQMTREFLWKGAAALALAAALVACGGSTAEPGSAEPRECEEGERVPSHDGCNTCRCHEGRFKCTLMGCPRGDEPAAASGDDEQEGSPGAAEEEETAAATEAESGLSEQVEPDSSSGAGCVDGSRKKSEDGCNTCSCRAGSWACTKRACRPLRP